MSLAVRHRLGVMIAAIVAALAMVFVAVFVAAPARADAAVQEVWPLTPEIPAYTLVCGDVDWYQPTVPASTDEVSYQMGSGGPIGDAPVMMYLSDGFYDSQGEFVEYIVEDGFENQTSVVVDGQTVRVWIDVRDDRKVAAIAIDYPDPSVCDESTPVEEPGRSEAAPGRNGTNPGLGATNGNAQGGKPEVPVRRGQTVASRSGDRVALVVSATTASQPAAAVANIDGESLASGVAAGKSSPMLELQSPAAGVAAVLALIVLAVYGAVRSFRSTRMPSRV